MGGIIKVTIRKGTRNSPFLLYAQKIQYLKIQKLREKLGFDIFCIKSVIFKY